MQRLWRSHGRQRQHGVVAVAVRDGTAGKGQRVAAGIVEAVGAVAGLYVVAERQLCVAVGARHVFRAPSGCRREGQFGRARHVHVPAEGHGYVDGRVGAVHGAPPGRKDGQDVRWLVQRHRRRRVYCNGL